LFNKVFRKPTDRPPRPSWVKWLLFVFIFYVVLQAAWRPSEPSERTQLQVVLDNAGEELKNQKTIDFSSYKNRLFPEYNAATKVKDIKAGTGPVAMCGQEVAVKYKAYKPNNTQIDDKTTKDKPLTFQIGARTAMPVLEEGVPGMQVGGTRSMTVPLSMSYGLKQYQRTELVSGEDIRFELELLSVKPVLGADVLKPYRIVDVQNGYGNPVICGKTIRVNLIIWDVSGKELYSTVKSVDAAKTPEAKTMAEAAPPVPAGISFTPGRGEVFYGLEQGVIGMHSKGVRTLIVPPALQKTLTGKPPAIDFPFPQNQTVLVDVEYLP
jgi:FKBP-type peptidyl-prolyl cis-trans isomerase